MTDQTEPLDLDPIKARLEAATIGPWEVAYDEPIFADDPERYVWELRGPENAETASHHIREIEHLYPHDAELIAHAPTDIEALITEVERLRALVDHQPVTIHITKPEPDTRVVGVPVIVEGPLRERYR